MESTPGTRLATSLHHAFEAMVAAVVDELERRGHPGVTATLEFALVAVREGAQDASALGRALGVTKQAAAKSIATLESLGYVSRIADPADARRKRLVVSDRGEEMVLIGAGVFDRLRQEWLESVGVTRGTQAEAALTSLALLMERR